MERRRIVDAVTEKADDMAAVPQPKNDAILLSGRDPAEEVRLLQPRAERFLTERFDLGAGQHPGDRNAEFGADMLRHALVVAAEDLDANTLGPKRGDGRPGARLWRIEKDDEAGKNQILFVGSDRILRSGSQITSFCWLRGHGNDRGRRHRYGGLGCTGEGGWRTALRAARGQRRRGAGLQQQWPLAEIPDGSRKRGRRVTRGRRLS